MPSKDNDPKNGDLLLVFVGYPGSLDETVVFLPCSFPLLLYMGTTSVLVLES